MITLIEHMGQPIVANYTCDNNVVNIDPNSIMVDIEGLHAIATGNYTRYMPISLENSISSWTYPYMRPVIMHHNEEDGKIIGRIHAVEYKTSGTRSGTPALVFTVNIPDEEGKQQIIDGRLLTTSVGINATDCRCSICGHNIAEYGPCEHKRGHEYKGEICYWDIYAFSGKELSYVITPSDPYTHNIKIYSPNINNAIKEQQDMHLNENLDTSLENQETTEVINDSDNSNVMNDQQAESPVDPEPAQPLTESETTEQPPVEEEVPAQPTEETPAVDNEVPLQESSDGMLATVLSLTEQLATVREELNGERRIRESLETTLSDIRSEYKKLLASTLNGLRVQLGKSIIESQELVVRTEMSLRDSITDCENELALQESQTSETETEETNPSVPLTEGLKSVESPVTIASTDTDGDKVKVTKQIDIKETFDNLDKILFR